MVEPDYEHWKGLLALEAVGQLDRADRSELVAHTGGCRECREDRADLAAVVRALDLIDGAIFGQTYSLEGAPEQVSEASAARDTAGLTLLTNPRPGSSGGGGTIRRSLLVTMTAVAAIAVVVVGALALSGHPSLPTRTVALHGHDGAYGTAVLVAKPWGTSIDLSDRGQRSRQILTVSMQAEYGRAWTAGSFNSGDAGGVRVTLACALPIRQIRRVVVMNSSGNEILHS
jgi:hypothetical protein